MIDSLQPTCAPTRSRLGEATEALVLVLATLLAYLPALKADFIWDDDAYVVNNATLRTADGLWHIWFDVRATPQYYPLVHTNFWIEHQFWGLNATGYHLTNIILHVVNSLLLWRLLHILALPGAWVAAMVFALHPVHVESVAWITERKNVLSGMFYLGSALCYVRYAFLMGRRRWYLLALILFVAALLSKTVTASLPAALALVVWWKRGWLYRRDWLSLAPMFIIGGAFGLLTAWLEWEHVEARGPEWDLSLVERTLIAGRALWLYLWKLLWPMNLAFSYPRWRIDVHTPWQYLYPLGCVALLMVLWKTRQALVIGDN